MNPKQLIQSIQETEAQLEKLKKQLQTPTIQEAKVGDTLEDGSIVIKKENGLALLVAPESTEVRCRWTKEFPEVYLKLTEEGFIPSQWFIPSVEQLQLAYKVIPSEFDKNGIGVLPRAVRLTLVTSLMVYRTAAAGAALTVRVHSGVFAIEF